MAWDTLGSRIQPNALWQFSPEVQTDGGFDPQPKWIRARHFIDGRAKFTQDYPFIRVSGRIGVGTTFQGLRQVSQELRIDADAILQVYLFTIFPEAELTRVALYSPFAETLAPRWEVQLEEWN